MILITGSTDGLGRELARRLARQGVDVIVHGRNHDRGAALCEEIERETHSRARFYPADFASLDEVRALAFCVLRDFDRLDVLINNAGVWQPGADGRRRNAAGHEIHFAVNYLSGYVLTHALLPLLRASAPSRVVNVTSNAQAPIDFADVMLEHDYSGARAYAQSKLAQVMFTIDLARRLERDGIAVNAVHPATLMDTAMVRSAGAQPRNAVDAGVQAVLRLVASHDVGSGRYYHGTRQGQAHDQAYDAVARTKLRMTTEALLAPVHRRRPGATVLPHRQ